MKYEEFLRQLEDYDQELSVLDSRIKDLDRTCDNIESQEERLEEEYKDICEERDFIGKAKTNAKLFSLRDIPLWLAGITSVLLLANLAVFLPVRIFTIAVLGISIFTKVNEYVNGKYILKKFAPLVKELEDGKVEKNMNKQKELEKLFMKTESQKSDLTEKKLTTLQAKSDFQNSYIKSVVDLNLVIPQEREFTDSPKQLVK